MQDNSFLCFLCGRESSGHIYTDGETTVRFCSNRCSTIYDKPKKITPRETVAAADGLWGLTCYLRDNGYDEVYNFFASLDDEVAIEMAETFLKAYSEGMIRVALPQHPPKGK